MTTNAADEHGSMPMGVARRTMGIILLLLVVVLWTTSNFLGSVSALITRRAIELVWSELTVLNQDNLRRQVLCQALLRYLHQHVYLCHAPLYHSWSSYLGPVAPGKTVPSDFVEGPVETFRLI